MTNTEKAMLFLTFAIAMGAVATIITLAGRVPEVDAQPKTLPEPTAPSGVVVLRDDAPSWCLDPSYPRGDMWYESCAEPVR